MTTAVACLPVLVLGMGAALAHLLRADARQPATATHEPATIQAQTTQHRPPDPGRLAGARAAAAQLAGAGQRISRRNLRAAGIKGSNTALDPSHHPPHCGTIWTAPAFVEAVTSGKVGTHGIEEGIAR